MNNYDTWKTTEPPVHEEADEDKCKCPGVMRTGCPCDLCHGRGWYPSCDADGNEEGEMYCEDPTCEAGKMVRVRDGGAL